MSIRAGRATGWTVGCLAAAVWVGCEGGGSDRMRYATALRAVDLDSAWEACVAIDERDLRADCASAAVERFGVFDRCAEVPEGRWRDECFFMAAEAQGRRGEIEGALLACQRSAYAAQCGDHLLGIYVMGQIDADVATLGRTFESLRPMLAGPRIESQFWRSYFRNRIALGREVDATACPSKVCRAAADQEVGAAVRELQRQAGDAAWCEGTHPWPDWARTPQTRGWVDAQVARGCSGGPSGVTGPGGAPAPSPLSPGGAHPPSSGPVPSNGSQPGG